MDSERVNKNKKFENSAPHLRDEAESILTRSSEQSCHLTGKTPDEIIHELRVHQIELEIQNEELKKARQDLEDSRNRYIDLYDFAPIGYFTLTDNALIEEVNLTGAAMLGIVRQDLIRDRFRRFVHQEDRDIFDTFFHSTLSSGFERVCELRLVQKGGPDFSALIKGIRVGSDPSSFQIRMLIHDLTERKRTNNLAQNNQYNRSLIEASVDPLVTISPDGTITDVNIATMDITGCGRDVLIGTDFVDYFTDPEKAREGYLRVFKMGQVRDYPLEIRHQDGHITPVLYNASVYLNEGGDIVGVIAAARDISERKRAEEELRESERRYREIFDQSPIAIERYDAAGTLMHVNQACLNLFGIEDMDAIPDFSLFSDPNISGERKEKLLQGEAVRYQGSFDFEKVKTLNLYPTNRKGTIWLDVQVTPLGNTATSITGFLAQIQDITNRSLAEKQLHESEIKHRALFKAIADPVFLIDQETGTIVDVNPAGCRQYGFDHDEFIRMHAIDVSSEPEKTELAIIDPESYIPVRYHHRKDGSMFPVEFTSSSFLLQGRNTIIATARDITERTNAEEKIQISETRYRRLFESAQDGILILNRETGEITDSNLFIETLTGYSKEELIGKSLWEIGFIRDQNAAKRAFEELQVKDYIRYEDLPLQKKDGKRIDVEFVSNVYPINPLQSVIQCNIRDISERKRTDKKIQTSETRYRRLFESAQDGILILNRDTGEITDSNPFIETLTGYSKDELIGRPLWDIGFIRDQNAAKRAFEELQALDYIRYEGLPLENKNGKRIDVEFVSNVYPVDPLQSVIQCNIRDISDRIRAEEALNEAGQKLRLLTGLTRHDIINQICAVQLLLDLALDSSNLEQVREYLFRAQATGNQIEATIGFTREYENFGTNSSGWLHIQPIIDSAKTQVSLSSVTVENRIPEDIEVYADPIIRKVFTTLLENAIRHGVDISTIWFSSSELDGSLIITCADDGGGIPTKEKEYIFDHGYGKHTGIGLFLAREILSITGLSVREVGVPGKGAQFEIIVPTGKFRRSAE